MVVFEFPTFNPQLMKSICEIIMLVYGRFLDTPDAWVYYRVACGGRRADDQILLSRWRAFWACRRSQRSKVPA